LEIPPPAVCVIEEVGTLQEIGALTFWAFSGSSHAENGIT
jgi:hypothetical protein